MDSTFATPLLLRPLELGAGIVVHSATKYLAGHGDVLGGAVVSDPEHADALRSLAHTLGPVMSPFESYLTMRGIKTLALRMERQCANACKVASWLSAHPRVEPRVFHRRPGASRRRRHRAACSRKIRPARWSPSRSEGRRPRARFSASWTA